MVEKVTAIALGSRLKRCRNVLTLGVRPNFSDYTPAERDAIYSAETIYYPGTFYAGLLHTAGINTFPGFHNYATAQDKIKQTALFTILDIPHPETRVFYGHRQQQDILNYFDFPFIAKIPRGSARGKGVFLIKDKNDLACYLEKTRVAYIQRFLKADRDIRVVIIGQNVALAYFRIAGPGEFRANISAGGSVSLEPVPGAAVSLALDTARKCQWNDVGIDIINFNNRYFVLEANMRYGKEGFRKAGIDYYHMMEQKIDNREI